MRREFKLHQSCMPTALADSTCCACWLFVAQHRGRITWLAFILKKGPVRHVSGANEQSRLIAIVMLIGMPMALFPCDVIESRGVSCHNGNLLEPSHGTRWRTFDIRVPVKSCACEFKAWPRSFSPRAWRGRRDHSFQPPLASVPLH